VLASIGALRWLVNADLPLPLPITLDLSPDAAVLAYSLGISMLAGIAFGLVPAMQATRTQIATVLREETPGGGRRGRVTLRGALVSAQVAVSLILLTTAGLLLRSFRATQDVDPGFGGRPSAIVTLNLRSDRWNEEQGIEFANRLMDRFVAIPGVTGVGLTGRLHLDPLSNWNATIDIEGVEPPPDRDGHLVDWTPVTTGFFDVMGIGVVQGRSFTEADRAGSAPVVVVNEAMARRFWPGGTAVGATIRYVSGRVMTVIGVMTDAKVRSLGEAPRPQFYRPFLQAYSEAFVAVANTTRDPEQVAIEMARAAREADPDVFTYEPKSMARHLATQLLARRLAAWIVGAFAVLALVLASVGLYGLVSYAVSQRRREVGIRMSLGADRAAIMRLLLGGGMRLVVAGVIVGLIAAFALARLLRGLLYGVDTIDPLTFIAVPIVLGTVAFAAAWLPARRAMRVDPGIALRAE
jgi:predicted permease